VLRKSNRAIMEVTMKYAHGNTEELDFKFDVGVEEKVPFWENLLLSIQNISVMPMLLIFPGIIGRAYHLDNGMVAYLYGVCFMVCGFTTIFQSVVFLRLPVVQGPWAPTLSALIVLGHFPGSNLGVAFGSFFVASLIWCLLALPIRGVSVIGLLSRYFMDPVVAGVIITLAMIQLAGSTVPHWLGEPASPGFPILNILIGTVALSCLLLLMLQGNVGLRRGAVLISLIFGSAVFFGILPGTFHGLGNSPFFIIPQPFLFGFGVRPLFVLIFLLGLIPSGVQSIAMYELLSTWMTQKISKGRISQGVFAMALGATLAGIFGSFATVFYATNLSLLQTTKVGSRFVTLTTGILLVVLGCFAKVDLLFAMIPGVVIAAVSTLLFGVVFCHSARMIFSERLSDRKLKIVGLSLFLGFGGLFVPDATLHHLPIFLQTFIAQPVILGGGTIVVLYAWLCQEKEPVPVPREA
jgi:xanthine/uracil permease